MRLLRFETTSAAANLSLDEALLLRVNWGLSSSAFRSWRTSRSTVVLGVGSEAAAECDIEECRRRGVKICRRSSGGAAVLLEAGALCATLVAPYDELRPEFRTIGGAHRLLGGILVRALGRLGVEAHCAGTSDVAAGELKLAGLSQSRKRRAVMIHASVLVDPDMDLMDAALPHPPTEPAYRGGRQHREFLTCLDELAGAAIVGELERALAEESGAKRKAEPPMAMEISLAGEIELSRYMNEEWTLRR